MGHVGGPRRQRVLRELAPSRPECDRDRHRWRPIVRRPGNALRARRPGRRRRQRSPTASAASASGASRCRRSPSSPTRRRSTPSTVGDADPQGPDARNLWRNHWYNDLAGDACRRSRARRPAARAHRRRQPDHRRLRRSLPDDHGPQGARRLRLPRPADRHRAVRPDDASGRSGRRPATTPAAGSPSAGSWPAAASPSSPRG